MIAEARLKTDVKDSEALARLLQLNRLPEAYVPPIIAGTGQTSLEVDGVKYQMWVFTTESEIIYARPSKSRKVLEEVLEPKWRGTLVCDGLCSHTFAKRGTKIQHAGLIYREAGELVDLPEARFSARHLHRLYDRLTKAVGRMPPPRSVGTCCGTRGRTMQRWLSRNYRGVEVRRFAEKVTKDFDFWFIFVLDSSSPTNNATEGALRERGPGGGLMRA